jgi:hypothetical protein
MRVRLILIMVAAFVLACVAALILLGPAHGHQSGHAALLRPTSSPSTPPSDGSSACRTKVDCLVERLGQATDPAARRRIEHQLQTHHVTCSLTPKGHTVCKKPFGTGGFQVWDVHTTAG